MYYEATIKGSNGGFGEYDQQFFDFGEGWEDEQDLINECYQNVNGDLYELGVDELPDGLDDIRGSIHNQDGRIFGWLDDRGEPHYFAIVCQDGK